MIEWILWSVAFIGLFLTLTWLGILYVEENHRREYLRRGTEPTITITIPAYNEEKNIQKTIDSILEIVYPQEKIQIIIVNDGSTDKTEQAARKALQGRDNVLIINKANEGKAVGLNTALKEAKGEYFAVIDADTTVEKQSIKCMMPHFTNPEIGSVISSLKVANPKNVFGKVQRLEYLMATFMRSVMTSIKTLHVTPGALSIYRTELIKGLGGFDEQNITEDYEMALKLKAHGYDVVLEKRSIVYTNVPLKSKSFWRQRIRWSRGFIYNHVKYKNMVFNKKYNAMGTFQLPLNIIGPIILIISLATIFSLWTINVYEEIIRSTLIKDYLKTRFTSIPPLKEIILTQNLKIMFPILLATIFTIYLFILVHRMSNERIRDLPSVIVYFFIFPYITAVYWISSIMQEIKGSKRRW